jgi:hypothetical protein
MKSGHLAAFFVYLRLLIVSSEQKALQMTEQDLISLIEEVLEERKKKRKKSKKKKEDRCTRIAKRKYDVWPSAYASGAVVKCRKGKIWKNLKEEELAELSEEELLEILSEEEDETLEEKKRKLTKKPSSETSLRDWFARLGAPGKKGGWVDCNAPIRKDGKIAGYKSCGRQKGEKRSKYPACRPTKAACKSKGKGTSWGKRAKRKNESMDNLQEQILSEVMQLLESTNISEGMQYHLDNQIPITEVVYRPLSEGFMSLMKEARTLYSLGLYEALTEEEKDILESDLGEVGVYEGQEVPLDLPMVVEEKLDEAKYKGKDVKLNKPQRGGSKKFYVYVRDPKSGNIRKVSFGDPNLSVKIKDPERRKSFVARHKCKEKKDKTTAGFWACRVGRYPHLFGGKTKYTWW